MTNDRMPRPGRRGRAMLLPLMALLLLALGAAPVRAQDVDIALNKPVSALTNAQSGTPADVVDGDYATTWYSYQGSSTSQISFVIDLEAEYPVTGYRLRPMQAENYLIETSLDGSTWTSQHSAVFSFPGNADMDVVVVVPYQARYIRYTSSNSQLAWAGLAEIEVLTPAPPVSFAGGDGSLQNPWQISTPEQLDSLRNYLGAAHADQHFVLVNDIDLNVAPYNSGAGWSPIGNYLGFNDPGNEPFAAFLDGASHQIKGLFIAQPAADAIGLFALADGATLTNLELVNSNVSGRLYVGTLVGLARNATLDNVGASGGVTAGTGGRAGGIAGMAVTSALADAHSSCDVTVTGSTNAGGLVGQLEEGSTVHRCYATGKVSGAQDLVGGLVGEVRYDSAITSSFATGEVVGNGQVGGLVGDLSNASTISDSYASGKVSNSSSDGGGLVGRVGADAAVANSFAVGAVSAASSSGGLIGGSTGSVTASFYDLATSGQNDTGKGTGLPTADLQKAATYAGWAFPADWKIIENRSYPYLAWQPLATLPALSIDLLPADAATNLVCGHALAVKAADGSVLAVTTAQSESPLATSSIGEDALGNPLAVTRAVLPGGVTSEVEARADGSAVHRIILAASQTSEVVVTLAGAFTRMAADGSLETRVELPGAIPAVRAVIATALDGTSRSWYELFDSAQGAWSEDSSTLGPGQTFVAGQRIRVETRDGVLEMVIDLPLTSAISF